MTDPYYNRFDPADNYENIRFVPGRPLQTAELCEIQSSADHALKGVADSILKDGNIVRDCGVVVNPATGVTTCEGGAIYLSGRVRGVAPSSVTVPIVGTVAIGIRLQETIITADDDPDLLDPATGTRAYTKKGANRLRVTPVWAWSGDSQSGQFFPVYSVTDGVLAPKEPPPQLDSVTQALAIYDRDSAGGSYVVSGMLVTQMADRVDGYQVYSIDAGRARVNGFGISMAAARRLPYNAQPVLKFIDSEPRTSTSVGAQRVNTDRSPIANITQVRITKQRTVTLVHGTVTGALDPLPDTAVLSLVSVVHGATNYVIGTDCKLTSGQVDWSLPGAEVAPGSSYDVTYQYIATVTPTAVDDTGFTVTGAVSGTLIQTSYNVKLPRIDRLCLDQEGNFFWVQGVSTDYNPVRPSVPSSVLPLAQVVQTWTSSRHVINDGVRVMPMQDLVSLSNRLDTVIQLVSEQKLRADVSEREASAKKGVFVDPFLSDGNRDQGITQTAAVVAGELVLALNASVLTPSADVTAATTCAYEGQYALNQLRRTGSMKINPYMAFSPLPAKCTLTPAVDRWTQTSVAWLSPITERFEVGSGFLSSTSTSTLTREISAGSKPIEFLRPIDVHFKLEGFGPGEVLQTVTFDGLAVTPTAP